MPLTGRVSDERPVKRPRKDSTAKLPDQDQFVPGQSSSQDRVFISETLASKKQAGKKVSRWTPLWVTLIFEVGSVIMLWMQEVRQILYRMKKLKISNHFCQIETESELDYDLHSSLSLNSVLVRSNVSLVWHIFFCSFFTWTDWKWIMQETGSERHMSGWYAFIETLSRLEAYSPHSSGVLVSGKGTR